MITRTLLLAIWATVRRETTSTILILLLALAASSASGQATSQWVFVDSSGRLAYQSLSQGDHIMDFSWAGYMGGGVTLPTVPVQQTVNPTGGDDTSAIQAAINAVSGLTPDSNGFRGAVLLAPGTFNISSTLNINASGVVLRGSGSGSGGTVINMTGSSSFLAVSIRGSGSYSLSNTANISDSYVPSGTHTITVDNVSGFSVGDNVLIQRPVTQAWIHFLGMDTLVRGGVPQTWLTVGSKINTDRIIQAISGNTITLDAPLTDSFDSTYLGTPVGTISKYTFPGRISQDGIEHLTIQAPIGTTIYSAVTMDSIIDSWMEDVVGQETQNAFNVNNKAKRITLDNVINNVSTTQTRSAGTADFAMTGTEVFVNNCQSNGTGDWPLITQATGTGPIAALNFSSTQHAGISPHQRWTTGLLADNATIPNAPQGTPGIAYRNRGTAGSGQGWTTAWSVAWNVTSPWLLVSAAPGTENWCIGCVGSQTSTSDPNGIFDSLGTQVTPSSLYLAQLCERLGPSALTNIGYSTSFCVSQGGGLPPGWSDTDVGTPGQAGSASFNSGTFTVNGGGADIWGRSDNFHYGSESVTGTVTITARVVSQQNTNAWAKSGVMIRETTAANSSFVHVFVTPGHGVNMQYRASTGASAVQLGQVAGPVAPTWVRLVRSGNTFTGSTSADGVTWTSVGTISVTMASGVQAGLSVTAHNNTALNTSTFDNVSVGP